jgi:hypothetical protein
VQWPDAVEIDRVVPASGNMSIGPQQFWLGPGRTGQQVRFWIDTTTVHLCIGGWRIKTVPSRLPAVDIARLRQAGASAAGPPPAGPAPGALAATSCVEVQRLVNSSGIITLANQVIAVGSPLAGQRARIRLDGQVIARPRGFGGSGNLVGVIQTWPSGGGPVPAVARIIEELHHHGAERSSDDLTGAGDSQAGRWRR